MFTLLDDKIIAQCLVLKGRGSVTRRSRIQMLDHIKLMCTSGAQSRRVKKRLTEEYEVLWTN